MFNVDISQLPIFQENLIEETNVEKQEVIRKEEEDARKEVKAEEPAIIEERPASSEIMQPVPEIRQEAQAVPEISYKQYKIETNESSYIKLPSDYSTDDGDEKKAVDLINQTGGEWIELKKKDNYVVYIIPVSLLYLIYSNSLNQILQL